MSNSKKEATFLIDGLLEKLPSLSPRSKLTGIKWIAELKDKLRAAERRRTNVEGVCFTFLLQTTGWSDILSNGLEEVSVIITAFHFSFTTPPTTSHHCYVIDRGSIWWSPQSTYIPKSIAQPPASLLFILNHRVTYRTDQIFIMKRWF